MHKSLIAIHLNINQKKLSINLWRLPNASVEIGSKNWFVFRQFFVNYVFNGNKIVIAYCIVGETLATTTVTNAQRRTGVFFVVLFWAIGYSYFYRRNALFLVCTRHTGKYYDDNWQYDVCKFQDCKNMIFIFIINKLFIMIINYL